MNEFFDLIKNLLVVCCLLATLSATCRQEQTRDRIDAKIDALLIRQATNGSGNTAASGSSQPSAATSPPTCRQEQTRDQNDAKIDALLSAELETKGNNQ